MIQVEIRYLNDKFYSLSILGHGGEEKGEDIYCAGVSSCLIGALNALTSAENYSLDIKSGDSKVECKQVSSQHDEIVMETLITQLQTIAKSYPEHVQIKVSKKEGKL